MLPFETIALLLSLFITISYGQTNPPTLSPSAPPTISCKVVNCHKYISNTSSWLISNTEGCKDKVDGVDICTKCPDENNICRCVSENDDPGCALKNVFSDLGDIAETAAKAFSTIVIVAIVAGSVCGLCIIGCIVFAVVGTCMGSGVCADSKKRNQQQDFPHQQAVGQTTNPQTIGGTTTAV